MKRWIWINGNALSQQGAAWPEIGVTQFGTENTGCQRVIRSTIEHIRSGTSGKNRIRAVWNQMSQVTTDWVHAVRNRMSEVAKYCSHAVCNQMSLVTTGWGHPVRNRMSQVATGWSHAVWNWMTTPYKDYIRAYSFLQTHTYVTHRQNKVEFELCLILPFICTLDVLPYNLLPPCKNVTTSAHVLPPSNSNANIAWSCDVMSAKP